MVRDFIKTRSSIFLSDLDDTVIDEFNKYWVNKNNSVFIFPNKDIFLELIVNCVIKLEKNFQLKYNPIRRTSVLIISRNRDLFNKIQKFELDSNNIFKFCNEYHRFLIDEKKIFCDMNDLTFSMLYWKTYLSKYFNNDIPNLLPLHFIFPVASGRINFQSISRGDRNKIGRKDIVQPPTFIFTDTLKGIENESCEFDYIFIDASSIKSNISLSTLSHKSIPYFVFFDNPLDIRIPYVLGKQNKNYVCDIFEYLNRQGVSSNKYLEFPKVELDEIVFKYISSEFEETLEQVFELMHVLYKVNFSPYDLKIIRNLLYNAVRMTIDGLEYDFIARFDSQYDSITNLIKELKESDSRYEHEAFEKIIELIEDIYNKHGLDTHSPKYHVLEQIINRTLQANEKILVVASGKIDTLGLKEKISIELNIDITEIEKSGVYIKSYQDVKNMQNANFDLVVLTSAIRISDLSPILKSLGNRMIVLLYKLEIRELKTKFKLLSEMPNELSLVSKRETIYEILFKKIRKIDIDKRKELPFGVEDLLDTANSSSELLYRLNKPYFLEGAVEAKLVEFSDGSKVFLRLGNKITYLSKSVVKEEHLKNLKGNEEIIVIKNDIKEDLYKIFVENLSEKDKIKQHYLNIQEWRNLYEDKFVFLKLDDKKLYEQMIKFGWNKSTKALLKNWRSGYSYGPRDLIDIKILGKVLSIQQFIDNADFYYTSMRRIRGERIKVAKLLNKIIYSVNKKFDADDTTLLENYNLSLEEIQDAIDVKTIVAISQQIYKVKPSEIGRVFN